LENIKEQTAISAAVDRLWAQYLPQMEERVTALEVAAAAFAANNLSITEHEAANAAAHKLAGILGTFGLTKGTVLARELEIMYSRENGPDSALSAQLALLAAELRELVTNRK
jgi:HPt (histidine-containing phosphotransfer) domain-containing protein